MKSIGVMKYLKRATDNRYFNIKKIALTFSALLFIITYSCSQNKDKQSAAEVNKPKIDIKVNKQYDDKGNVIGYDSTYSYSFSDSLNSLNHDTTFSHSFNFPNGQFHSYFNNQISPDSIFKNDPFFNGGGFSNNPFSNFNFNFNTDPFGNMNDMMRQMEELQKQMQQNMMPQFQFPNQPIIPGPDQQNKPQQKNAPLPKVKPKPKPLPPDTIGTKII